jgi:hypothetical protein
MRKLFWLLGLLMTQVVTVRAQYSDIFVGKLNGEYILVDVQLPVYKDMPVKLDKWMAHRLFEVEDSSLRDAYSDFYNSFKVKMVPKSSNLKLVGKNRMTYQLKWYSYVEGQYASFWLSKRHSLSKKENSVYRRGNHLYDLKHRRMVQLEDIFEKTVLSEIYERFRGHHYGPVVKQPDVLELHFWDMENKEKIASFNLHEMQELFKPDFLKLMGIEVTTQKAEQPIAKAEQPIAQTTKEEQPIATPASPQPQPQIQPAAPKVTKKNDKTFVIIFANEHYQEESPVEYALKDGDAFRQCCLEVLNIPEENIHIRKDATLNNMRREMHWLKDVANAYQGDLRIMVYYAGHGVPDESTGQSYLLPVDGTGASLITGYSLDTFYQQLSQLPSRNTLVFLDACFSGSNRGKGMLTSARGVAIKAKSKVPEGKMVVFSAAQGNETAYPLREKEHGLFTYYLLEKLRDTKGEVSLGDLQDYVSTEVLRKSVVINGKKQTPTLSSSPGMGATWKEFKMK